MHPTTTPTPDQDERQYVPAFLAPDLPATEEDKTGPGAQLARLQRLAYAAVYRLETVATDLDGARPAGGREALSQAFRSYLAGPGGELAEALDGLVAWLSSEHERLSGRHGGTRAAHSREDL